MGGAMVGRTRLYQRTGSPLIQGRTKQHRPRWPWVLAGVVVAVAIALYILSIR